MKNGHWLSDGVGGHFGFACLRGLDDTKTGQDRTGRAPLRVALGRLLKKHIMSIFLNGDFVTISHACNRHN